MMQCKREKEIGPKKLAGIIEESVLATSPPYGYILAAPVHFSKAAHDKFREELRSRGVMEFYLWGAGEIEDLLYQPKNDHILFAFFGISLTSRRRSRSTTVRAVIVAKNKLAQALGDKPTHQTILLRDINDTAYPFSRDISDFVDRPRWKEYEVSQFHALGVCVYLGRYYAYLDKEKSEWDFAESENILSVISSRHHGQVEPDTGKQFDDFAVKSVWEQLPRSRQVMLVKLGLIRFDSILIVDDKGDVEYQCPHAFVDFDAKRGPIAGSFAYLEINQYHSESPDKLKRVKVFPSQFANPTFKNIYKDRAIVVSESVREILKGYRGEVTLYATDHRYDFLEPMDVIAVEKTVDDKGKQVLLKVTNKAEVDGSVLLRVRENDPARIQFIESEIGEKVESTSKIRVVEAMLVHDWQIDQDRPVI